MPTFSILIPNYNYRRYLPDSVGSLLAQTFPDFEAIICDDGSTDGSWEYITAIEDPRFSWCRNTVNSGISATINHALASATGEFIAVLDPDDRYHPQFLQRQLEVMRADPAIDISGTWVTEIDSRGHESASWDLESWFNADYDLNDPSHWVWQNHLAHGSAVIRASAHAAIGEFDVALPITVDYNFWVRALVAGHRFHLIHERLFDSRVHGSNVTNSHHISTVRGFAYTASRHLHPFLASTGRLDLLASSMANFFADEVIQGADPEIAEAIVAELAGSPTDAKAFVLGIREFNRRASGGRPKQAATRALTGPRLHVEDIREAELARATFWAERAMAAEHQAAEARATNAELMATRDTLAARLRSAEASLSRLRRQWPVKAARYANMQRLRLQQQRAEAAHSATAHDDARDAPAASIIVVTDGKSLRPLTSIRSITDQTLRDWELVVALTGPAGGEVTDVLQSVPADKLRMVRLPAADPAEALGAALERCTGSFVTLLQPGDELEATFLEKSFLAFTRHPDVDVVFPTVRSATRPGDPGASAGQGDQAAFRCSVRRQAWQSITAAHPAGGGEGAAFWSEVAKSGHRGLQIPEALVRETVPGASEGFSEPPPVSATVVGQYHPFGGAATDAAPDSDAVQRELGRRAFRIPTSGRPQLVVFVPWLLDGGGAAAFLQAVLGALREDFDIVVIATHPMPAGSRSAVDKLLAVTPYVYDIPTLVGVDSCGVMVESILGRLQEPDILIVGSPWAYANIARIRDGQGRRGRVVDVQFNHVGHLAELLDVVCEVDLVLASHDRLRRLLVDYYQVPAPVKVLYIAPPDSEEALDGYPAHEQRQRLRIGWLGRNSPEKCPELVADIALAVPEADFVMAGSRLESMPELPANVHVEGWVPDAVQFLAGLDFILNTSEVEGISLTAMKALQVGIPVMTRDVGGMAELVRDGENGLIYSASDLPALADRLRDRESVARIQRQARQERLPAAFHFDRMVQTVRSAILGEPGATTLSPTTP